jgi:hypothetical protein
MTPTSGSTVVSYSTTGHEVKGSNLASCCRPPQNGREKESKLEAKIIQRVRFQKSVSKFTPKVFIGLAFGALTIQLLIAIINFVL